MIEEIKIDRLEELIHEMMIKIRNTSVTNSAEGNPIEIENAAAAPLLKCVSDITGVHNLNGYDKPWAGGTNINKMVPGESKNTSANGVTIKSDGKGVYTFVGTCTQDFEVTFNCDTYTISSADDSTLYLFNNQASSNTVFVFYKDSTVLDTWSLAGVNRVSAYTTLKGLECNKYGMRLKSGVVYNLTISPMIAIGASYVGWSPYANICKITAYSTGSVEVEDEDEHSTTYSATFSDSIYQGSIDYVAKKVTATWGYIASYDGETLPGRWISDRDEYAAGTSPTNGAEVAYELASASTETVTVSNAPVSAVHGYNKIESSTGEMEVTYITEDFEPLVPTT